MTLSTEAQLRSVAQPQAQWRELFDHSPVMYFMVNSVGTVLAVNTFGAAHLGYTVSELVGQSVLDVFFPDDKDAARKNLNRCLQTLGQQNQWEIRKVTKDGKLLWVRESAKALRRSDGDLIVLVACEDVSDRKRGEQRLAAQYGVTRVLSQSNSIADAAPDLLQKICEALDWDWGGLWNVDQQAERLHCNHIWHVSGISFAEFDALSREIASAPGQGRTGQVWQTGRPLWTAEAAKDPAFRRGPTAERTGLHTNVSCPILLGREVVGIVEFFSRITREPDEQELDTLSAIGSQIGQFIQTKRAEQAVQASERRFRALIEHAHDIVLVLNARGTLLYASPSVERLLGYTPEELVGRSGYDLIHPDHLQESIDRFTQSVTLPRSVITGERLLLHKDGSPRWAENVIVNLLAEPSVQAIVMHLRDIAERKQAADSRSRAEENVREQKRRLDAALDNMSQGLCMHDRNGGIVLFNRRYRELMGDDEETLNAPTMLEALRRRKARGQFPPDPEEFFAATLASVRAGKITVSEMLKPNSVILRVVHHPMQSGDWVTTFEDVTERRRADEALRESEQRFRDYAEIASDWLWETGPDHRFTMWSAAGMELFTDFIGKRRWELAVDREEESPKWRAHIADLEAHKPFRGFRYNAWLPDGSTVYVSVSGKPVFGADGNFLGYRGVATDITAAMRADQAERALRQAQNELAHVTRVTTMGELAASIAHEVSQPVSAALNNASAALRFLDARSPDLEEAREALGCVVDNTAHAADVIDRIRAHLKKAPPRKDSLDLNAAISEVIALTRSEVANNKVLVRTDLAERLPPVWGDRVQLQQVVLNLILNAVEAMSLVGENSRELLISTQQTPTDDVLAAVRDSGPGIDPENLEQVFESFYTTKPGGVGIGLSICRSIIEAHGGRLWAAANEYRGAAIQFCLPAETRPS